MNISKEQGLLIAYGGRPYIPPREVHKDFFAHIGFNAFKASGVRCELPFPIFRLSDSRKSEYFVSVRELARQSQTRKKRQNRNIGNSGLDARRRNQGMRHIPFNLTSLPGFYIALRLHHCLFKIQPRRAFAYAHIPLQAVPTVMQRYPLHLRNREAVFSHTGSSLVP